MRVSCSAVILISCAGFTVVISYQLQDKVENTKQQSTEMLLSTNVSVSKHDTAALALSRIQVTVFLLL
jgi:hypothetical protein